MVVLLLQLVDQRECALDIGVGEVVTDLDQCIRDATHGTEDDDLEAIVLDQGGDILDAIGGAYRGAAKFHDNQL